MITQFGANPSSQSIVFFSEPVLGARATRLAAAVVWRGTPVVPRRHWWDPFLAFWRPAIPGQGPNFHLRGTQEGWGGSAGGSGERATLYHARRGIVRVLGRDHPLPPDGRTLVLLIDEGAGVPGETTVRVHTIATPRCPIGSSAQWRQEGETWTAALHADPLVHAFIERA